MTKIAALVSEHFDLSLKEINQMLNLLPAIYIITGVHDHLGRDKASFTWERTKMATTLPAAAGLK